VVVSFTLDVFGAWKMVHGLGKTVDKVAEVETRAIYARSRRRFVRVFDLVFVVVVGDGSALGTSALCPIFCIVRYLISNILYSSKRSRLELDSGRWENGNDSLLLLTSIQNHKASTYTRHELAIRTWPLYVYGL